jgi:hypothetical protein
MKIIVGLIAHAQLVETKAVSPAIRGFARGHASSSAVRVGSVAASPCVARLDASNQKCELDKFCLSNTREPVAACRAETA